MEKNKLFYVTNGLFYPAFLGNMSYLAADKIFKSPESFDLLTVLLVLALTLHYVMDWSYTFLNFEKKGSYSVGNCILDFIIIACLFVAFRLVLGEDDALFRDREVLKNPAVWLCITKVCCVLWEACDAGLASIRKWKDITWVGIGLDLVFGGVYATLLLSDPLRLWAFNVFLFLDGVFYFLYERELSKRLKGVEG